MEKQIQFTKPQNSYSSSKNKKLIIVLLILLPLIVVAYIGFNVFVSLKSAREKANLIVDQQNKNQFENIKKDQEYSRNYQPTAGSDFFNDCMKNCSPGGSETCKNLCTVKEAAKNKDMSECDSLSNVNEIDGKDSAKAYCQSDVAAATLDQNNCEKITYGNEDVKNLARYECYSKIATAKKDAMICEKIPKDFFFGNVYEDCLKLKEF